MSRNSSLYQVRNQDWTVFNICWRFCRWMRLGKPANCIIVYIIGSALIYTVGYIIIIIVIALAQQLQAQNGHGSIFPAELADNELSYPTWWLSSLKCVENGLSLKSANFRLLSVPVQVLVTWPWLQWVCSPMDGEHHKQLLRTSSVCYAQYT